MTDQLTAPSSAVRLASGPTPAGTIDDFELFYARRVLRLLKSRLGREALLELVAPDIEEGNAFLRAHALASEGRFTSATTVLAAPGLTAAEFVRWMQVSFADEDVLLSAHPEHYAMSEDPDGTVHVVENVGPHICSFLLGQWGADTSWADDVPERLPEDAYPFKRASDLFFADGTVVGRVLVQFGDTDEGLSASLTCYFPATCPPEVLDHHSRHFAVEFRNWIVAAVAPSGGAAS
jgi:hypothetical protein